MSMCITTFSHHHKIIVKRLFILRWEKCCDVDSERNTSTAGTRERERLTYMDLMKGITLFDILIFR